MHAYETWGFKRLTRDLIDSLNIWARFIYGPLLQDRVRTIADGVKGLAFIETAVKSSAKGGAWTQMA